MGHKQRHVIPEKQYQPFLLSAGHVSPVPFNELVIVNNDVGESPILDPAKNLFRRLSLLHCVEKQMISRIKLSITVI
jgi:hypothetical protein